MWNESCNSVLVFFSADDADVRVLRLAFCEEHRVVIDSLWYLAQNRSVPEIGTNVVKISEVQGCLSLGRALTCVQITC